MTRLTILTLLVIGHFTYGQSTDSISIISFTYSKGHSSWGNPGNYGKSEYIEYVRSSNGQFNLTRFFRVTYTAGLDGKTFHKDTVELTTKAYSIIDRKNIQVWLAQLNTHNDNYTEAFVKPYLSTPTHKEVKATTKLIESDFFFGKDFKEEKQSVLRKIQSFSLLDSFLIATKPTVEGVMMVTDVWDFLKIKVISNSDTAIYESQFYFDPLGQPIVRSDHKDISKVKSTINLETNIYARAFLPKESLIYKALDINNLKRNYIEWWLKRDL